MSGPKKSSYEIRQEIYEQRKREKEQRRESQIYEIKNEISNIKNKILNLTNRYGEISNHTSNIVNNWISELENSLNGDLRECWRSIKGINNYLNKQSKKLEDKQKNIDRQKDINQKIEQEKQLREQKIKEQELIKQAKIDRIIKNLESVESDYKEILNEGIIQRVKLFKESIKTNPDNQNTLKQIESFKSNLLKQYEEYQNRQEDKNYVANVFSNILNSNIDESDDGSLYISGKIDGVPISVRLNNNNNHIDLDTPTDGTCQKGLESLQNKLNNSNINLGAIKVLKTGQTINTKQQQSRQKGMKA